MSKSTKKGAMKTYRDSDLFKIKEDLAAYYNESKEELKRFALLTRLEITRGILPGEFTIEDNLRISPVIDAIVDTAFDSALRLEIHELCMLLAGMALVDFQDERDRRSK